MARAAANRAVIEQLEPVILPDVWDEQDPLGRSFRQVGREDLDNPLHGFHAWLGVPLIHRGRAIGMLALVLKVLDWVLVVPPEPTHGVPIPGVLAASPAPSARTQGRHRLAPETPAPVPPRAV